MARDLHIAAHIAVLTLDMDAYKLKHIEQLVSKQLFYLSAGKQFCQCFVGYTEKNLVSHNI